MKLFYNTFYSKFYFVSLTWVFSFIFSVDCVVLLGEGCSLVQLGITFIFSWSSIVKSLSFLCSVFSRIWEEKGRFLRRFNDFLLYRDFEDRAHCHWHLFLTYLNTWIIFLIYLAVLGLLALPRCSYWRAINLGEQDLVCNLMV